MSRWKLSRSLLVPVTAVPLLLVRSNGFQSTDSNTSALETKTPLAMPALQTSPAGQITSNLAALPPTLQPQLLASPATAATERVALAGGRVSFVLPAGFTALTPREIALKFPGNNPPQHVYGNDPRSVSVAFTFPQAQLAPEQLPEFKDFMQTFLEQMVPGLKWITRDFVVINSVRWVRLELISRAVDTNIHNDIYFTSFDGKLLGLNLNSTVEKYDGVKAELLKFRNSISISL